MGYICNSINNNVYIYLKSPFTLVIARSLRRTHSTRGAHRTQVLRPSGSEPHPQRAGTAQPARPSGTAPP